MSRKTRRTNSRCHVVVLALAVFGLTRGARGEAYDQGSVLTVTEENDGFVGRDRHYSQGLKLAYLHTDDWLPGWARGISDAIPALGYDRRTAKFGYEIGQSIYTPDNILTNSVIPNDRPFAGLLYTGFIWQRRGRTAERWPTLESIQLDLGVIGPASLAEDAQKWAHRLDGSTAANGWRNQLENEFALALKYQRVLRFSAGPEEARWLDFLPHAGFSLGNIETSARIGGELRLGWHLPDNFGFQQINSLMTSEGGWSASGANHTFGVFLFASAEGKVVGYSTLLDGNLFESSHNVTREPFVAEWTAGGGFTLWRLEAGLAFVTRTKEFEAQKSADRFGSLYLKIRF